MANFEQQLLDRNTPRLITQSMNIHFNQLDFNDEPWTSLYVLLKKTYGDSIPIATVRGICEDYVNTNSPQHADAYVDIIPANEIKNLHQVIFDDDLIMRNTTFNYDSWPSDSGLALEDGVLLNHSPFSDRIINACRKLAIALILLRVHGKRFIRADRLIDTFHQGNSIGQPNSNRNKVFDALNVVAASVLWNGDENWVVKKWVADHYDEENPFKYCYFQVKFDE